MNINPTRMELTKLKNRLRTAIRGHKLLKDKNDELMKQFLDIVRENMKKREIVEKAIMALHDNFTVASAVMSPEVLIQALMLPKQSVSLMLSQKNIMGVKVPEYGFNTAGSEKKNPLAVRYRVTSASLTCVNKQWRYDDLLELRS
jgi:V/A-type H+-transporting ATPase subunit D